MNSTISSTGSSMAGTQVKEKRTRKRQRLSCVECTKRRQKCDRQSPCGLCVSRGVAHLCHWASGPISRPTPAQTRLPNALDQSSGSPTELATTIKTLSERLALLERTISVQNRFTPARASSPAGNISVTDNDSRGEEDEDEEDEASPPTPLHRDVHEAAVTLAQLSLAHHGEYVGNGSVLCALHKLGSPANICLRYSKSTESTCTIGNHLTPELNQIQSLIARGLPPRQVTDILVFAFFDECNWRFGISEKWFRSAYERMWRALDTWGTFVGPGVEQINANWLSLLFAALSLAPSGITGTEMVSREACFTHALSARRLAEDTLLNSFAISSGDSVADGTVLGCFATVLIGSYLASRGRVSEAWKLLGGAIRSAQAAGMHRDPGWAKWQVMSQDERILRSRGWWNLVIGDQLYSNVLGRPAMINAEMMDVPPPSPKSSDGSSDAPFEIYLATMVKLCEVVGQAGLNCAGPKSKPYAAIMKMDHRYDEWLGNLPKEFRWYAIPPTVPTSRAERILEYRRHNLAMWYLACRMNLHRPWLTRATPPILPLPTALVGTQNVVLNPSREKCITLAMELVHTQCAYAAWATETSDFSRTFFVFDGAVTLISALAYAPGHTSAERCIETVERAMENLEEAGKGDDHGGIARRATQVLSVLRRAGGWRETRSRDKEPYAAENDGSGLALSLKARDHPPKAVMSFGTPAQHTTSSVDVQPTSQSFIPFLASSKPSSFYPSSFSGISETLMGNMHSESQHEGAGTFDRQEASAYPFRSGWNNNIPPGELDVHMMMPFEILQGMPLDQDWGNY
ncbi:hypothetical protein K439DRAFT_1663720 [Ramaria rubella]|nr:hypothetical protein K439DRAFT_1663720 [Ramaria rubella]